MTVIAVMTVIAFPTLVSMHPDQFFAGLWADFSGKIEIIRRTFSTIPPILTYIFLTE